MNESKFWVVMGTSGLSHSPCRHFSEAAAYAEAGRLSRLHKGTFFVLEATGYAALIDVQVTRFDKGDGIPF
jgi:hypothetical protein